MPFAAIPLSRLFFSSEISMSSVSPVSACEAGLSAGLFSSLPGGLFSSLLTGLLSSLLASTGLFSAPSAAFPASFSSSASIASTTADFFMAETFLIPRAFAISFKAARDRDSYLSRIILFLPPKRAFPKLNIYSNVI